MLIEQVPDWLRTGIPNLAGVIRSALPLPLEELLAGVEAPLSVVHAERDAIGSHARAARPAENFAAQLLLVPGGTHSWPYGSEQQFADTALSGALLDALLQRGGVGIARGERRIDDRVLACVGLFGGAFRMAAAHSVDLGLGALGGGPRGSGVHALRLDHVLIVLRHVCVLPARISRNRWRGAGRSR